MYVDLFVYTISYVWIYVYEFVYINLYMKNKFYIHINVYEFIYTSLHVQINVYKLNSVNPIHTKIRVI